MTLAYHKDKVYVIYLTYNIKDSTKMQGETGKPSNNDHQQSSLNQIVDQGEQSVQRIQKSITICYMCPGVKSMQSTYWARHMTNFHNSQQGIHYADWWYKGEEKMMNYQVANNSMQSDQHH